MIEIKNIFRALANTNRLRIIKMLEKCSLCVCDIKKVLGTSQPAVSRYLNVLKKAGLLESTKEGEWVYYRILKTKNKLTKHILGQVLKSLENDRQSAKDRKQVVKLLKTKKCKQKSKRRHNG